VGQSEFTCQVGELAYFMNHESNSLNKNLLLLPSLLQFIETFKKVRPVLEMDQTALFLRL